MTITWKAAVTTPRGNTIFETADGMFRICLVDQCEGHQGSAGAPSGAPSAAARFAVAGAKVDRRGRIVVRFTAPGPGRATVRASARLSRSIRMTVGSASRTVSRAGKATLTVKTSRAAKRALRSRGRVTATLKIAFKPAGGGAVSRQVRRVTLRRW